jgi:hypothetical protein
MEYADFMQLAKIRVQNRLRGAPQSKKIENNIPTHPFNSQKMVNSNPSVHNSNE